MLTEEIKEIKKKRVSFSQYSTFLKCPQKWYLDYVKNLRVKDDNINTTFGTAIHHAFQTLTNQCDLSSALKELVGPFVSKSDK